MKKNILVFILAGILILGLFVLYKLDKKIQEEEAVPHEVVNQLVNKYLLKEEDKERLESMLTACDVLITESLNEAVKEGQTTAQIAKERYAHMQRVSSIAIDLLEELEESEGITFTQEEAEDLMLATYLHDIRKYAEGDHAQNGATYIKAHLPGRITLGEQRIQRIATLIYYHNEELTNRLKEELGENLLLVELIQDADAVDKIINQEKKVKKNDELLNLESSRAYVDALMGDK